MEQRLTDHGNAHSAVRDDIAYAMVADYVARGKTVVLPLRGRSMRPFLEDKRDKALLAAVPATLRRGDVIMARLTDRGGYALHRITHTDGENITMCGDGNVTPEQIRREDVIAIALGFYRDGGKRLERVDTVSYRLYWHTWLWLKPIRRWLLLMWRLCHYPRETVMRMLEKVSAKTGC